MKLLVDSQLPIALARYLSINGLESVHVEDVGLATADDRVIWDQWEIGV
jgi:predicted nuclease of predicted toxin-antitoxin system